MIKSVLNVESPREHVFSILTDYPNYTKWMPGCEKHEVVSSSGSTADTNIVISSMKKMKMGLRFEAQPTQSLNFHMTSGKDLKSYIASYRLMDSADGKGTVIIVEMELDAGAMVPKFMVDRIIKKSIDDTCSSMKAYIQKVPVQAGARPAAPPKVAEARPRRARRIMQVMKTADGYRVWMMGETHVIKSR